MNHEQRKFKKVSKARARHKTHVKKSMAKRSAKAMRENAINAIGRRIEHVHAMYAPYEEVVVDKADSTPFPQDESFFVTKEQIEKVGQIVNKE